ncbi:MAG: SPFH domain-containing protein [Planctomycetota bacterium]
MTAAAVAALVRACGTTIQSGTTGLLYSFGRVKKRLEPGFHVLIPFVQIARVVPTRSRTLDLEDQRVVTSEGLVFLCRANVVFRVAEIEKALVEVDDLVRAMRQRLALSVQELLRGARRQEFVRSEELDERLAAEMSKYLVDWGVVVESAGFQSIAPSPRTIRVTQLRERVAARVAGASALRRMGLDERVALGLVGTRSFPVRAQLEGRRRAASSRRRRLLERQRRSIVAEEAVSAKLRADAKKRGEKPAEEPEEERASSTRVVRRISDPARRVSTR